MSHLSLDFSLMSDKAASSSKTDGAPKNKLGVQAEVLDVGLTADGAAESGTSNSDGGDKAAENNPLQSTVDAVLKSPFHLSTVNMDLVRWVLSPQGKRSCSIAIEKASLHPDEVCGGTEAIFCLIGTVLPDRFFARPQGGFHTENKFNEKLSQAKITFILGGAYPASLVQFRKGFPDYVSKLDAMGKSFAKYQRREGLLHNLGTASKPENAILIKHNLFEVSDLYASFLLFI
jgi:hypothetical protein